MYRKHKKIIEMCKADKFNAKNTNVSTKSQKNIMKCTKQTNFDKNAPMWVQKVKLMNSAKQTNFVENTPM